MFGDRVRGRPHSVLELLHSFQQGYTHQQMVQGSDMLIPPLYRHFEPVIVVLIEI